MFKGRLSKRMDSSLLATPSTFDDEDVPESFGQQPQIFTRAYLMVLDYKQFLAARNIQAAWRGFQARAALANRNWAAITIQRWWRGFSVRQSMLRRVEDQLQKTLWQLYNRSATIIQALFRGWHTRRMVHNMYSLKHIQLCAAEDLLSCVAYKLHHLLRTYSIPGVYSLRNSHCLSKVEQLLATMSYRFHNSRVSYYHARQNSLAKERRESFQQSEHFTYLPYAGPNFNSVCKPQCQENLFATKQLDRRMYGIISEFERTVVDPTMEKTRQGLVSRKMRAHVQKVLTTRRMRNRGFCGDVIESMRRWKFYDGTKLTIDDNVFSNTEALNGFLDEAALLIEQYIPDCHCTITNFDEIECR